MIKKLLILLFVGITATACYNTRVMVGNVGEKEPLVKVNKQWNSHFIAGLVPAKNAKMNPSHYVNGAENYVVRTYTTFVNGLVSFVTLGIYTPTETAYYIPAKDLQMKEQTPAAK